MATPGKVGAVMIQKPLAVTMTAEATTANAGRTRYQITDTAKQNIDIATTPTVYLGGVEVSATLYNIEYAAGTVVFLSAQEVGSVITITGKYLDSNPVAFTDEATTGDDDNKRYTITDAEKCYWDRNTTVTVKVDDVTQSTGFHIEYPGGVVVFDADQGAGVVTVSGSYFTVAQILGFFNWDLKVQNKTLDVTTYESSEWEEFALGTKNWTATAEKFWIVDASYFDSIGNEAIIVLYTDFGTAKARFEGYTNIASVDIGSPVGEMIKEKIEFTGVQGVYFRNAA
jgi:hypothetical protein